MFSSSPFVCFVYLFNFILQSLGALCKKLDRKPSQKKNSVTVKALENQPALNSTSLNSSSESSFQLKSTEACAELRTELKSSKLDNSSPALILQNSTPQNQTNNSKYRSTLSPDWFSLSDFSFELLPYERLHKEIFCFTEYLSPTATEVAVRQSLIAAVEKAAIMIWPNATVYNFGSFYTNTFLPLSDLDLVIIIPNAQKDVVPYLKSLLLKLNYCLQIGHSVIRASAKVPILNLTEVSSGLSLDICINVTSGIESSSVITKYLTEFPDIRDLIVILKLFLDVCSLNKPYKGGLSAYGLMLLVISFFQTSPLIRSAQVTSTNYLGLILLGFFEFYGFKFDADQLSISVNRAKHLDKIEAISQLGFEDSINPGLILLDPQDETKNVARSCFAYTKIQQAFRNALSSLKLQLKNYETCRKKKIACKSILTLSLGFWDTFYIQRCQIAASHLARVTNS